MIAGVLFDLGGVLCSFDARRRTGAIAAASGASTDVVEHALGPVLPLLDSGAIDEAALVGHLRRTIGWRGSADALCDAWSAAFAPRQECLELVRRVAVPRGILTNNGPPLSTRFARALPALAGLFDAVVFSADIGQCKPSPQAFEDACAQLGTDAANTVFVDDTPSHVVAAQALGLDAIVFTSADELAHALAQRGLLRESEQR